MGDMLMWDNSPDIRQLITEKDVERLISLLGVPKPYSVDMDSDEVITIMWDEQNFEGPNLILLEKDNLIVGSGRITDEEEKEYVKIYKKFVKELKAR